MITVAVEGRPSNIGPPRPVEITVGGNLGGEYADVSGNYTLTSEFIITPDGIRMTETEGRFHAVFVKLDKTTRTGKLMTLQTLTDKHGVQYWTIYPQELAAADPKKGTLLAWARLHNIDDEPLWPWDPKIKWRFKAGEIAILTESVPPQPWQGKRGRMRLSRCCTDRDPPKAEMDALVSQLLQRYNGPKMTMSLEDQRKKHNARLSKSACSIEEAAKRAVPPQTDDETLLRLLIEADLKHPDLHENFIAQGERDRSYVNSTADMVDTHTESRLRGVVFSCPTSHTSQSSLAWVRRLRNTPRKFSEVATQRELQGNTAADEIVQEQYQGRKPCLLEPLSDADFQMIEAVKEGDVTSAAVLFDDHGSVFLRDVGSPFDDTSLLHTAVRLGQVDMIKWLRQTGAPDLIEDQGGLTPYDLAEDSEAFDGPKRFELMRALNAEDGYIPPAQSDDVHRADVLPAAKRWKRTGAAVSLITSRCSVSQTLVTTGSTLGAVCAAVRANQDENDLPRPEAQPNPAGRDHH